MVINHTIRGVGVWRVLGEEACIPTGAYMLPSHREEASWQRVPMVCTDVSHLKNGYTYKPKAIQP